MKKTLIALAVAASAAVSGSAMAWIQDGVNGGVNIGVWGKNNHVDNTDVIYSGVYASAVKAGSVIKLTLNSPANGDIIKWTAQLPVTVSYQ
ncbi:hypothetical protein ACEPIY_005367 [Escherichia coli]